jgi:endonuclease III
MATKPNSTSKPPNATVSVDVDALLFALQKAWPDAVCEIDHKNAYQLLVGTILAAQSTDKRINMLTPALFKKYPSANALAQADAAELEVLIHSSGFFRAKAKSLLGMARAVVADHKGSIPKTMNELVQLPGVARKTGNVILGTAFGIAEGIVVDTHVTRLSARLGLTTQTDAVKIENDLCAVIPKSHWISFANQIIWHGRRVCHAKKPDCGQCSLAPMCPSAQLPAQGVSAKPARTVPSTSTSKSASKSAPPARTRAASAEKPQRTKK